jgi:hypothetical protein
MTTTNTYNPLLSALRELTTPEAFRWYGTQAKATAALAQTITHYSVTTAQRLLSDSNPVALAAVAEPESAESLCEAIAPAIEPEPELDDGECDCIANDEPESAMLTLQESASTEPQQARATHQEYTLSDAEAIAPEPDFGEAIACDGETELAVGAVPLDDNDDDDDTELRYWAELELPSILDEEYSHLEDDTDNSAAGAEAED